jgi:hypothetical protein
LQSISDTESFAWYQKLTGFALEEPYNLRLKKGWTRGLATDLKNFFRPSSG